MAEPAHPRTGPLTHIRVLDLGRIMAAPWATQILADLGADVIKIERPGAGDDTRAWGPPFLRDRDGNATGESGYFLSVNRGKRSVAVDIATAEGQQLIRAMAQQCDVVIENFKVGALAKYGLDAASLRGLKPSLVYCSVTGFGQDGPRSQNAAYDFAIQAMGGLMSVTGERNGEPGGGPQKVGIAVTDVLAGMYASLAITAAIAHRERTGVGQYIDLALLDSIVAFGATQILNYFTSGKIPGRYGNAHANVVPYEVFATADGHLILAVGNDSQFASFCKVAGRPELAADPRYGTMPGRITNRATLLPLLREIFARRPSAQWIAELEAANVPCGPINNYKEVFEDPQVRHRGLKIEIPHQAGVPCPTVASPMRFSETPVEYMVPPPLLGEHTREVLGSLLGLGDGELDRLATQKII